MAGNSVIGALRVVLGLDSAQFTGGLSAAQKELKKAGKSFEKLGSQLSGMGRTLTLGITAPVAAAGAGVLKMAGDFETAMNKVSIASQASAKDLKAMEKQAIAIGKSTVFSASEAAGAMEMLAKNGVEVKDILGGAAAAATNLAAAAGSELEPAAAAISDTMAQFKVNAAELPMVVNQITGAVNESKLDFGDFQLAMAQAGGVAANFGVEFEDFTAALAATSPLFQSGSDAGTSFKTFLTTLTPKSKEAAKAMREYGLAFYDSNGQLKSMAEIAQILQDKFGGMSEEMRGGILKEIFGVDAMRTAIALMDQGAAGIDKIKGKIGETDAAAQAAKQMEGFNGQLEQLRGALEGLAIAIGQSGLLEFVTDLVKRLSGFAERLSETNPELLRLGAVAAAAAAAVGPLLMAVGGIASGVGALLPVIGPVVAVLAGPWGVAIAAAVAAVILFKDEIAAFGKELFEAIGPKIKPLFEALKELCLTVGQAISAVFGGSGEASMSIKFWGDLVGAVFASALDIVTGTIENITSVLKIIGALLRGDFSAAWGHFKDIIANAVDTALKVLGNFAPGAAQAMKMLYTGVKLWLQDKLGGVFNWVVEKLAVLGRAFYELYDKVVGHSYVPDMVDGIEAHMARLDKAMVKPAEKAADRTAKAFEDLQQRIGRIWEDMLSDQERAIREFTQNSRDLREGLEKGVLSEAQFRELHERLWNDNNPITGVKAPIPGGDLKTIQEANDNWQAALDEQEDAYDAALKDMGQSFRGFFQELVTTGKADWKRLLLDLTSNWNGTMQVLQKAIGGRAGGLLGAIGGALGKAAGSVGTGIGAAIGSAMGLGSGNGLLDAGLSIGGAALGGMLAGPLAAAGSMGALGILSGTAMAYAGAILGPIGAIAGLALGSLFKKKPSNNGALATLGDKGFSLSGNKRTSETEQMATAAAQAILQGQEMLRQAGLTLTATVHQIDVGTRDATDILLTNGQALTAGVGDAAAAAETALKAVLAGATYASDAQKKLAESMLAAGAGFDEIITALVGWAQGAEAAKQLPGQLADEILKLTDAKAYELEMLKRDQAARREALKAQLDAAFISEALFASLSAQMGELEKLELGKLLERYPDGTSEAATTAAEKRAKELDDARDKLADSLADVAEGYEAQAGALESVADRLRSIVKDLRSFREGLNLGSLSALSPAAQMAFARALFERTAARARGGDEDAMEQLPQVAQSYLQAAREMAPNAATYAQAVARVRAALEDAERAAVGELSIAEQQLDQLKQTVDQLKKTVSELERLNTGVQGVAEAIAGLGSSITSALGAEIAAALGNGGGPGMPAGWTPDGYLQKNPDVLKAFNDGLAPGSSAAEYAKWHYETFGKNEPRGFAFGGGFTVGGWGGSDSQLVQFRASPGEHVQVSHGRGADDTAYQVAQMRNELNAAMAAVAVNTGKAARLLDRWDGDGLPEERAVA